MRLGDLDDLKKRMCELCNQDYSDSPCEPNECVFYNAIQSAPTIGAVSVVRCRECKNLYVGGVCFGETLWACRKLKTSVDPEFFCGFGEQKEDEHDKHPSGPV